MVPRSPEDMILPTACANPQPCGCNDATSCITPEPGSCTCFTSGMIVTDPATCSCACPSNKPFLIPFPTTPTLGGICSECNGLNRIKMKGAPLDPDGCCPIGSNVTSGICKVCTTTCPTPGSFIPATCICCTPERTLANNTCCSKSTEYNSLEHCCTKSTTKPQAWATKSNKCCITGKIADDTECCAQVLDAGHCCPTSNKWATVSSKCCLTSKLTTDNQTCCEGGNPVRDGTHCCPTSNKWATVSSKCCPTARLLTSGLSSGSCCDGETPYKVSSSVCSACSLASRTKKVGSKEADGCCANSKPYVLPDGACSDCNAPGRRKLSNSPEPDGCCLNGTALSKNSGTKLCCPSTTPYNVNDVCSVCDALNRSTRVGSNQRDKCCPDSTPYVLGDGTCSAKSCTLMFHVDAAKGGELDSLVGVSGSRRPKCLDTIITASRAKPYPTVANNGFKEDAHDNFVAEDIYKKLAESNTNITGEIKYAKTINGRGYLTSNVFLSDLKIYFDQECKPRPPPTTAALSCDVGSYAFGQSPVALLWEPSFRVEDLARNVALVSFPIDPKHADKLVEWKASSAAPLLVYDPSGEGKITSGYQLFGNWTFGPTKVASLAHSTVTNANGDKLWENGFEALAQLDSDANGEVSAEELEPLSLWFDDNRNGISENGEVRRLSAVGVRKLFYRGYEGNDAAHAIVLKVGFERERNGVLERGTMVDWFTESVSSELEYAQRALLSSVVKPVADLKIASLIPSGDIKPKTSRVIAGEVLDGRSESLALKKGAELARGVWKWSSKSKDIPVDGGFFVISDNQDGTIQGLTMIELPIDSSFGASSIASVVGFKGTAKLEDSGKVSINFELNKEAGTDLQSSAELNGAGDSMSGSSHGTIKREAANTEITYSWSADKLK